MLVPPQSVVESEQLGAAAVSLEVVAAPLAVAAAGKQLAVVVVVHTLVAQVVLAVLAAGLQPFAVVQLVQLLVQLVLV